MKNNFILGLILLVSVVLLWFFINREGFISSFSSSSYDFSKYATFKPSKSTKKKYW